MNAPLAPPTNLVPSHVVYGARCYARATLFLNGHLSLHEAVDELQTYAEQSGLIDCIGQDAAQEIMSAAFMGADMLPGDDLDETCEREIMLCAADRVRRWELDDERDRWKHTGEQPPAAKPTVPYRIVARDGVASADELQRTIDGFSRARAYRTPQATVDAFWYVARQGDANLMRDWLENHPRDKINLLQLLKNK